MQRSCRIDMGLTEEIPEGVILRDLKSYRDDRGCLTEVFRSQWANDEAFLQWNFVESEPNTLRGVHVHPVHADYLVTIQGLLMLGLHDLRNWSPTFGMSCLIDLSGDRMQSAFIPPGVAHGFYFPGASCYFYGVTDYWSPADELGCIWNDPQLGIPWPVTNPVLSQRDRDAGSFRRLMQVLQTEHRKSPMMAGECSRR
jgi:dTDP-4-dehydrorhamnose 3,5-epimerase